MDLNSQSTGRDKLRGRQERGCPVSLGLLCVCKSSHSLHTLQVCSPHTESSHKAQPASGWQVRAHQPPSQNIWAQLLQSTRQVAQQHNTACTPGSLWSWEKSLLVSLHSQLMKEEYSQPTRKNYAKHFVIDH